VACVAVVNFNQASKACFTGDVASLAACVYVQRNTPTHRYHAPACAHTGGCSDTRCCGNLQFATPQRGGCLTAPPRLQ